MPYHSKLGKGEETSEASINTLTHRDNLRLGTNIDVSSGDPE